MPIYPETRRTYGDEEKTPVPFPAYRCKSTAVEKRSKDNPALTYTHRCKITIDHGGDHRCVCGKKWPHVDDVAKRVTPDV